MNWYKKAQSEVLYHGSNKIFSQFDPPTRITPRGKGIFFSDSPKYAKLFGKIIYACYVNLNNPKIYEDSLEFVKDERISQGLENLYKNLQKNGHDGIIILKSKVSTGWVKEVISFYPENIKILNTKTIEI